MYSYHPPHVFKFSRTRQVPLTVAVAICAYESPKLMDVSYWSHPLIPLPWINFTWLLPRPYFHANFVMPTCILETNSYSRAAAKSQPKSWFVLFSGIWGQRTSQCTSQPKYFFSQPPCPWCREGNFIHGSGYPWIPDPVRQRYEAHFCPSMLIWIPANNQVGYSCNFCSMDIQWIRVWHVRPYGSDTRLSKCPTPSHLRSQKIKAWPMFPNPPHPLT